MSTHITHCFKKSVAVFTAVSFLISNMALAAQPVLATKPLGAAIGSVKPNLMFVLDASGSMSKEAPNDTLYDSMQCKNAVKDGSKLATIKKMEVSTPNTRLKIWATSFSLGVNKQIYLTIPGKPTLSGLYTIKVKTNTGSACPVAETLNPIPPTKVGEVASNAGTLNLVPGFPPVNTNPTSWGGNAPSINVPYKVNDDLAPVVTPPTKYHESPYVNSDPVDPGCVVATSMPANTVGPGSLSTQNLGGGFQRNSSGLATSIPSSACYWRDLPDTPGCKIVAPNPGNSGSTSGDNYSYGVNVLTGGSVTGTANTACYWFDPVDTLGCQLPANPGNSFSLFATGTPGRVIGTDGIVTTTPTWACGWNDPADANGCTVVSGSGFVVLPNGTPTSTPSGACGNIVTGSSQGCSVTAPTPLNTPNYTNDVNLGGGKLLTTAGVPTATNDSRCYWLDPMDTKSCPLSTYSQSYIEVDIAPESAAVWDSAINSPEVVDAYIVSSDGTEKTTCFGPATSSANAYIESINKQGAEPPLRAAKVNALAYDPEVSYQPPPWPKKVGQGVPAPLASDLSRLNSPSQPHNLLPSMDATYTSNWRLVRLDGTALDGSGNPNSAYWGGATNSTASVAFNSISNGLGFNRWPEMVYCDTPERLAQFSNDREWLESTRCQKNSPGPNTTPTSSNWPYAYPAVKSGLTTPTNTTNFYINEVDHQNGQPMGTKNPTFDFGGGAYYAFGELYKYAYPYYYEITPIEYCKRADLKDCNVQAAKDTVYAFPSYVRYCKTSAQATDLSTGQVGNCQATYTGSSLGDFRFARYGLFQKTEVRSDVANYPHAGNGRTDCVNPSSCSYQEEMTNMANWFAYYRTRLQLMKSAAGRSFDTLDDNFRIGLMTIDSNPSNYIPINDFVSGISLQKQRWFEKLYSQSAAGGTPLREALGNVGRIYAGQHPIVSGDDPMQYSCQQNYTLLTTDGYWNGNPGLVIDGSVTVTNQDNAVGLPNEIREASSPAAPDTLADVAKYYFDTDLRTSIVGNCTGSVGVDVCMNDVRDSIHHQQSQHMSTYTLGLGVDGNLTSDGYLDTARVANTDYPGLVAGTTTWLPTPVADDGISPITPSELATVDDLWHAAISGRGEYYGAKNPQSVITGIGSMLNSIGDVAGSGSADAVSNKLPVPGDNYAYSSNYTTGVWTGNVLAKTIDANATQSNSALWCVENELSVSPTCVGTLGNRITSSTSDTRTIYANVAGTLTPFTYANLTGTQQVYFNSPHFSSGLTQWGTYTPAQVANVTGTNLVDYLRGQTEYDDANTDPNKRVFRKRSKTLGDITDSPVTYVGKAALIYGDPGYSSFVASTISSGRSTSGKTVYVGANDGMLHAFDANNGNERWAFVPSTVMPNLWKLADKNYRNSHTNFVNGPMEVTDICSANCGTATAVWKTILVSGLGQGGRGYFALDVTDPSSPSLLWEVNSSTLTNMGYSYGKPVITKMADGTWVALLTSGYNNVSPGDGKGYLYVLNAYTGAVIKTLATGAGDTATPSGLAQVASYANDPTTDFTSLFVYGGDLLGNLWRFNINGVANAQLIAQLKTTGGVVQPITVTPTLTAINSKRVVIVGTGKYLEADDLLPANYSTQSIYALKDDDLASAIPDADLHTKTVQQVLTTSPTGDTRTITTNPVNWSDSNTLGWYINLDTGERENVKSTLVSGILFVPTLVPSTGTCDTNGRGWLNIFDVETGSTYLGQTLVSYQTTSPIVGFNLIGQTNVDGSVNVTANVTCQTGHCLTPPPGLPLSAPGSFKNTRAVWRELVE